MWTVGFRLIECAHNMIIFEYMGRQVASNMGGRRGTTFEHLGGQVLSDRGVQRHYIQICGRPGSV